MIKRKHFACISKPIQQATSLNNFQPQRGQDTHRCRMQDLAFIRRATSDREIHFGQLCSFNIFLINSKSRVILMEICSHPRFLVLTKLIAHLPITLGQKRSLNSVCVVTDTLALLFLPQLCFIRILYIKLLAWNQS